MLPVKGTLKTWKEDRGFGFIRPAGGGPDVFVHIRDFGDIARAPRVGDTVSYQPIQDSAGKIRAGDVSIDGVPRNRTAATRKPFPARERPRYRQRHGKDFRRGLLLLLAASAIGSVLFGKRPLTTDPARGQAGIDSERTPAFRCEGKTYCSQMNSCSEAKFYLSHCPSTKMDGDHDGIPCEQQWCSTW